MEQQLHLDESVDAFLANLKKLVGLFAGLSKQRTSMHVHSKTASICQSNTVHVCMSIGWKMRLQVI